MKFLLNLFNSVIAIIAFIITVSLWRADIPQSPVPIWKILALLGIAVVLAFPILLNRIRKII